MAVNHLPSLTDSTLAIRRYREATSYLVRKERSGRGGAPCRGCPPRPPSVSPSPPRSRPTTTTAITVSSSPESEPPSPSPPPSPPASRCRARPPSPPSPTSPGSKAPRSVSPGGTPAGSAGAALRRGDKGLSTRPRGDARRVHWAEALVASVHARPRTPPRDVAALFYSRADERRFRREAEAARVLADEEDGLSLSSLTSLASLSDDEVEHGATGADAGSQRPWTPTRPRKDYGISKAVVVFGGAARTYGLGDGPGGCAAEARRDEPAAPFAFDDAAFWNGQITWS